MRGVFLKREGASFLAATAAFLSERLSDLIGIVLIALPGAAGEPSGACRSAAIKSAMATDIAIDRCCCCSVLLFHITYFLTNMKRSSCVVRC